MTEVFSDPQPDLVAQVQQLLKMNESLMNTNESLKEMVISVVELLKDPARNLTYPTKFSKPKNTEGQSLQHSPGSTMERVPLVPDQPRIRNIDSRLSLRAVSQENISNREAYSSPIEHNRRMTVQEIQDEDESFKQKYKGRSIFSKIG